MNRPLRRPLGRPIYDYRTDEFRDDVMVANYLTQEERTRIRKDKGVMYVQTRTGRYPVAYWKDLDGTYGKAKVYQDGQDGIYLRSYDTIVCALICDPQTGEQLFYRYWDEWSRTTANHVNQFLQENGWRTVSKSKWMKMPLYTGMSYGEV